MNIAQKLFNEYYDEYVKEGNNIHTILRNFFPTFLDETCEVWDLQWLCQLSCLDSKKGTTIAEIFTYRFNYAVLENGEIYRIQYNSEKTGNITWNGDDEYFEEYSQSAELVEYIGKSENIKEISNNKSIDLESIESASSQIIDIIIDYENSKNKQN